jgi:hypothetical protein
MGSRRLAAIRHSQSRARVRLSGLVSAAGNAVKRITISETMFPSSLGFGAMVWTPEPANRGSEDDAHPGRHIGRGVKAKELGLRILPNPGEDWDHCLSRLAFPEMLAPVRD